MVELLAWIQVQTNKYSLPAQNDRFRKHWNNAERIEV
jgi:hypothetical protein